MRSSPSSPPPAGARFHRTRRATIGIAASVALVGGLVAPTAVLAADPFAQTDQVSTLEDTPVSFDVLANDTDADGDPLEVVGYTQPSTAGAGTLVIDADGQATYTPGQDFTQTSPAVTATYTVSDGTTTAMGWIAISVAPVNDAPSFSAGTDQTVAEDAGAQAVPGWATGISANGGWAERHQEVDFVVDSVEHPALFSVQPAVAPNGELTYTPADDANGSSSVTLHAHDNGGTANGGANTSDPVTFTITVTPVNDAPVAVADEAQAAQGSGLASYDVLANDVDVDGDTLSLVSATTGAGTGTAGVAAGKVTFVPLPAFNGDAVITYTITDGALQAQGTLTVVVAEDTVPPIATAPAVALAKAGRVKGGAPITISWSGTDAGSGVASYEVQAGINGGGFATVYSGPATSVTRTFALGSTLVFRVRATDRQGLQGDWATGDSHRLLAFQDTRKAITYKGSWATRKATSASDGSYRYSLAAGARATLSFTGAQVMYVAPRLAIGGKVKVYLDGAYVGRFSLSSSKARPGTVIWVGRMAAGSHRIRVLADTARRTTLDAFVVLR